LILYLISQLALILPTFALWHWSGENGEVYYYLYHLLPILNGVVHLMLKNRLSEASDGEILLGAGTPFMIWLAGVWLIYSSVNVI